MTMGLVHFDLPGRPPGASGVAIIAVVTDLAPLTVDVDGSSRVAIASRTIAAAITAGTLQLGDWVAALPVAGNAEQLVVLDAVT